jgi:endonuclease/exonuclease/phosphatase family metal-dependent hydrolase
MKTIRVLSYNIHKGFSLWNRYYVLELIRNSIQQFKVDLVLLQEVVGENEKHRDQVKNAPSTSQFEYLADGAWSHYAYGKNAVYDEGHHGNAILSHYPIKQWSNLDLSTNRWESRGLLHAVIDGPSKRRLHVMSLHLDLFEKGRQLQVAKVCEYINRETQPEDIIILGGDFNDWTENASEKLKEQAGMEEAFCTLHGYHAKSFPSFFPLLPLDRVYARNLKPVSAQCLSGRTWKRLSDHLALFTEFEID